MKYYIFDFDGTLADSKECSVLATKKAFLEMGLTEPSSQLIEHYMGIPIEKSFKEMSNKFLDEKTFSELLANFRNIYKEFEPTTLTAFPFIKEVLIELKKEGKQLFVVSSKKSDVLYRNLQALQIDSYFDHLVGSDTVSNYKPHPEGINQLVEQFDLPLERTVMIGDTIFDIQMGRAAGCMTCAVTWGSHSKERLQKENPSFLIDNVKDLLHLKL